MRLFLLLVLVTLPGLISAQSKEGNIWYRIWGDRPNYWNRDRVSRVRVRVASIYTDDEKVHLDCDFYPCYAFSAFSVRPVMRQNQKDKNTQ